MRTIFTSFLFAGIAAVTFALAGCGENDDAPPVVVKFTAEKYVLSGTLMSADTVPVVLDGSVTLNATDINGAAVNLYSDSSGGTVITTLNVTNGNMTFFLDRDALLPVTLKVAATASNSKYLRSSATVIINTSGTFDISIKLVDTSAAGNGLATVTVTQTANAVTGALAAPIIVAPTVAPTNTTTTSASTVTIPTGAVLTAADGTKLTGTVSAQVTSFTVPTGAAAISDATAGTTTALDMFPGGLGNIVLAGAPAATAQGSFASAAYVAVEMTDAGGNKATSSSSPFTVKITIPPGTINPETDLAVKVGDIIPVWTYNETTATWKAETDAAGAQINGTVAQDNATSPLYVNFTTNHFSYWNLDWFYSATCTGNLTFRNDAAKLPLTLKASFTSGGGYLYSGRKSSNVATEQVFRIPRGKRLNIFAISGGKTVASLKNIDWCANPNQIIDYTAPVAQKPVAVTVAVKNVCTYNAALTAPVLTTDVIYSGLTSGNSTTNASGVSVINVLPGNYRFGAYDRITASYFTDQTAAQSITAAKAITINIPTTSPSVCGIITGTTGGASAGTGILFKR